MDNRAAIVTEILNRKCSAIMRAKTRDAAALGMRAAVAGGFRMIEFTLTTPDAFGLIEEFAADRDLLVGAGTVLTPEDAVRAVGAGARFIVSPVVDVEVIREAHDLGVAALPGTFTATEMFAAHRAGADFCKLFPGPPDIATYVRSILAPLPELRIFPTNGVTLANVADILGAGAAGVGFTTSLFEPGWMAAGDAAAIAERARALLMRALQAAPAD